FSRHCHTPDLHSFPTRRSSDLKMHVVHARKCECGLPDFCVYATVRCCTSATIDKSVTDGALPHVGRERLSRFVHERARFDVAMVPLYCCAARVAEWQTQGNQNLPTTGREAGSLSIVSSNWNQVAARPGGGTGRRAGLKIRWGRPHPSSILGPGMWLP